MYNLINLERTMKTLDWRTLEHVRFTYKDYLGPLSMKAIKFRKKKKLSDILERVR